MSLILQLQLLSCYHSDVCFYAPTSIELMKCKCICELHCTLHMVYLLPAVLCGVSVVKGCVLLVSAGGGGIVGVSAVVTLTIALPVTIICL